MIRWFSLVLIAAAPTWAQDLTPKAAPQTTPIAIVGATLHTIDNGVIPGGTIWFDAGVIRGVHKASDIVELPDDTRQINGRGLHVYPGLIGANTTVGLQEISAVRATRDHDEVGDTTPEARAAVAVNPDSTVIPVTRQNGVLTTAVIPAGGLVSGRAAIMQLAGWTWEEMAVEADCGLVVRWPARSSRSRGGNARVNDAVDEQRARIDTAFRDAKAYFAARASDPNLPEDIRAEAYGPALRRERPVLIQADQFEQIQSAITWAADLELRPVLLGGRDALLCLDLLRKHDVGVIVTGTHRLPKRRDASVDEPFRVPARIAESGLRWCLASSSPFYNERNLPYHAATAVAHGLDHDLALRAITLSAAELLGVDDKLGSLAAGKLATLMITDGDPLEFTTRVRRAFVSGRDVDLSSKHSTLAEKYREKYRQMGLLK